LEPDQQGKVEPTDSLNAEQVSGIRTGIAVLSVLASFFIVALLLLAFCPHTFDRLTKLTTSYLSSEK
jgi:hypothetical protein